MSRANGSVCPGALVDDSDSAYISYSTRTVMMWSRIALQCHHLTDVVASTALAIPLAVLSKKILLPSMEFQFGNAQRALRKNKRSFVT